jgi:hypothetical protein
METLFDRVVVAIESERRYQKQFCADQGYGDPLSVGDELLLITAYLNKATAAWMVEPYPEDGALAEIRKIAAIAIRCMEEHEIIERNIHDFGEFH